VGRNWGGIGKATMVKVQRETMNEKSQNDLLKQRNGGGGELVAFGWLIRKEGAGV